MKQFEQTMNTVALDLSLQILFTTEGRDKSKAAYDLLVTTLGSVYAAGADSRSDEFNNVVAQYHDAKKMDDAKVSYTIKAAEQIGYNKGHADAMFAQAAEKLNAEAAEVHPCLAPNGGRTKTDSETAFMRGGVSALI